MEKKKFRFNIIDAVLILLVIAVIAALVMIFVVPAEEEATEETYRMEYVLLVSNINDSYFPTPFEVGDKVTYPASNTFMGTVTAEPEKHVSYVASLDSSANDGAGAEVYTELEGLSDYYVTVECECTYNDWGYVVDGVSMPVGATTRLIIGDMDVNAVTVKMTVLDS